MFNDLNDEQPFSGCELWIRLSLIVILVKWYHLELYPFQMLDNWNRVSIYSLLPDLQQQSAKYFLGRFTECVMCGWMKSLANSSNIANLKIALSRRNNRSLCIFVFTASHYRSSSIKMNKLNSFKTLKSSQLDRLRFDRSIKKLKYKRKSFHPY